MTNYVLASKLREMQLYSLETRNISEFFEDFISNDFVTTSDMAIVNYILDSLSISPGTEDEQKIINLYLSALMAKNTYPNLKNVNMAFWANTFLL